jgi:hypothetical protein
MKVFLSISIYLGLVLVLGLIIAQMWPAEEAYQQKSRDDEF